MADHVVMTVHLVPPKCMKRANNTLSPGIHYADRDEDGITFATGLFVRVPLPSGLCDSGAGNCGEDRVGVRGRKIKSAMNLNNAQAEEVGTLEVHLTKTVFIFCMCFITLGLCVIRRLSFH